MAAPQRFVGAWGLVSFETKAADGTVSRPWGDDPVGIIAWTESGHMSAQLGPRNREISPYVAYFGTLEAPDADEGELIHRTMGASTERLMTEQRRHFRFLTPDLLTLNPPPAADGSMGTLTWRRMS